MCDVLEGMGLQVRTAHNAAAAWHAMVARTPDLVILDLFMPDRSGFALRSQMLARPELARVPVIVVTGYWARPPDTLEVAAVLRKPLNLDRLVETVSRLVPEPSPRVADADRHSRRVTS